MSQTPTTTPTKDSRWFLNGKPGFMRCDVKGTGYFEFVFDDKSFADSFNINDNLTWEPCPQSRYEMQQERARKVLDDMGIKF